MVIVMSAIGNTDGGVGGPNISTVGVVGIGVFEIPALLMESDISP